MNEENLNLADNDYVLTEGSAWFTVKKFAVRIHATDEGVIVDIWRDGMADDAPIASTYAFDSECTDEEAA